MDNCVGFAADFLTGSIVLSVSMKDSNHTDRNNHFEMQGKHWEGQFLVKLEDGSR